MYNRFLKYSIDHLNSERIAGWCFHKFRKSKPIELSFFIDETPVGSTVANKYREDLKSYRMHPDGRCGFEFAFPGQQFHSACRLAVYAGNTRIPLETFTSSEIPQVLTGDLPHIFFMHIPKTGGTSLNAFATRYFPQGYTATHIEVLDSKVYPQLATEKRYIAGHLTLQKIKQYFDPAAFHLVTLVRDPFRQLHSHLRWIRKIAADRRSDFFLKHEACVRDLAVQLQGCDLRINANLKSFVAGVEGFGLDFFDNLQTRYFLDYRPERVASSDLEKALTNAKQFALIGTVEQFEDFARQFCRRYGIAGTTPPRAFNRLPRLQLFNYENESVRSILLPLVHSDIELYRAVQSNQPSNAQHWDSASK